MRNWSAAPSRTGEGVVLATKFGNVRGPDGSRLGISGRPEADGQGL